MIKRIIARFVLASYFRVGLTDITLICKTRGIYLVGRELYRGRYLRGKKLYQVIDDIDIETAVMPEVAEVTLFRRIFYIHSMDKSLAFYENGLLQNFDNTFTR